MGGDDDLARPEQRLGLGGVGDGAAEASEHRRQGLDVGDAEHANRPARGPEEGDGRGDAVPGGHEDRPVGRHVDGPADREPGQERGDEAEQVGVEPPRVGGVRAVEPPPPEAHATARRWATGAHS